MVIAAALLLVAGAAFAVSSLIQSLVANDAGLAYVYDADLGTELNQSQTIDGYTVTLAWAYADSERLTVAYTISGLTDTLYTNLGSRDMRMVWKSDTDVELPAIMGMGNVLDGDDDLTGHASGNRMTFFLSQADINTPVLDLHMELNVQAVTVQRRTEVPDASDPALWDTVIGPFSFDFSVPYVSDVRLLNAGQSATDQNITITLEKVVITPSQVSLEVCYVPPSGTRQWLVIPHLRVDGEIIPGSAMTIPSHLVEPPARTCNQFIYNAALYDDTSTWQFAITELVGMGNRPADQQRIAGDWAFEFTVP